MQTTTIAFAGSAGRFLSLKANFSQLKKLRLPAALLLAFAFFATPAAGQVTINAVTQYPTSTSGYTVPFQVDFTTAQTGLTASNFTVTGSISGTSVQSVNGSGTSWQVIVSVPNSYQSQGTIILNMVNSTGLSPGVSGLPYASPTITDVLYPLTGYAMLYSSNANPGYAKTGDFISMTITSNYYYVTQVLGAIGSNQALGSDNGPYSGVVGLTLNSSTPQGPIAYTWQFNTNYSTVGTGSGTSSIIFDNIAPTVSISAPSANIVSGSGTGSVSYTVTYADANFGSSSLTTSGITLNTTGTATGTVGLSGSGTSYTVTISNISGNGTLGISVGAGYAVDLAGNTDAGAGPSSTVNVVPNVSPSISYAGPKGYALNAAISPLTPSVTPGA